jgi:hypothetical protein
LSCSEPRGYMLVGVQDASMGRGAAYGEQQDAWGCRGDAKGEEGLQAEDQTQGAWFPRAGAACPAPEMQDCTEYEVSHTYRNTDSERECARVRGTSADHFYCIASLGLGS